MYIIPIFRRKNIKFLNYKKMETIKTLKEKGETDYDIKHDILFFKTKDREYTRSIEVENLALDIDTHGYVTGIQIFEASKFLNTPKEVLINLAKWKLHTIVYNKRLEVRLFFQVKIRNKIIEKNPIIVESLKEPLPDSELFCATT